MRLLLLGLMLCSAAASAEVRVRCATTMDELREELAAAQGSAEDDEVRVAEGSYSLDAPLVFAQQGETITGSLTLSGGWNATCTQQRPGAQWTKIDATGQAFALSIVAQGDILLSDLHLIGGLGLNSTLDTPETTTIQLSRVALFTDVEVGDAVNIFTPADRITFDNVLIDAFAFCGVAAATFSPTGRFEIFSSTIISRNDFGSAVCFDGDEHAEVNGGTNSVFAAPTGTSILSNGLPALLMFSTYDDAQGCEHCDPPVPPTHPDSISSIDQDMAFAATPAEDDLSRFTRVADATALIENLRDSGTADQPSTLDVLGHPRTVGAAIDRGAFELADGAPARIFLDGFE